MPKQEFRLEAMKIYNKMRHSWDIVGCLTDSLEELVEKTQFKEHELYIDEDAKPSLPMSADVEKAVETATKYTQSYIDWWDSVECCCEPENDSVCDRCAHVKNGMAVLSAISVIVAALKARGPLVSEPDFEEHDLYVYDDARPL